MLSNPLTTQSGSDWPRARKLIFAICLVSFMFQLYRITAHYYRYDTEFQTKLIDGHKEVLELPAITLCAERDAIFLKKILKNRFPKLDKLLQNIDRDKNQSSAAKERRRDELYYHFLGRDLNYVNFYDRSLKDYQLAECYLHPRTKWSSSKKLVPLNSDCSGFSDVLESRVSLIGQSSQTKCFTFFSRQQTVANGVTDLQIDMKKVFSLANEPTIMDLIITMDPFKEALDVTNFMSGLMKGLIKEPPKKSVFMFIHDGYGMPSFDIRDAIELKPGKKYEIRFWSTTKALLKHPFPSNCFDYHKNFNSKELSKSKDQCIHDCYLKRSVKEMGCLLSYYMPYLSNDDKLRSLNPNHCHEDEDYRKGMDIFIECQKSCQPDCQRTEYKFDHKERDHHINLVETPIMRRYKEFSFVNLKYKKDSDSEYRERPVQSVCASIQMVFIALLIWFGLSIFSFSTVFETVVNRAKPHMYYITSFDDKVSPSVLSVVPSNKEQTIIGWNSSKGGKGVQMEQPMIRPKFSSNVKLGSNVKLEHYNDFISKVVDGYPNAQAVELPQKKFMTQY